ncbi:MAG TPA: hypothetical protein VND64_33650 [Pirellulales bacterium]|nr:hypothetical protein [Pirellulales bacterium]
MPPTVVFTSDHTATTNAQKPTVNGMPDSEVCVTGRETAVEWHAVLRGDSILLLANISPAPTQFGKK